MATLLIVGKSFGSVLQPKDKYSEAENGDVSIKRTYRTLIDSWLASAPSRGSAHPDYPLATLIEREADQLECPWLCDVTLTYRQESQDDDGNENSPSPTPGAILPKVRYEDNASKIEVPITRHPKFVTDWKQYWDYAKGNWKKNAPAALQGNLTYIVGSVEESETTYFWGKPQSISTSVGQLSGGNKWLCISGSRRREGAYWSRTLNRVYSKDGWPSLIYT